MDIIKTVLILGSHGMAGHAITRYFRETNKYQVMCVGRNDDETTVGVDIEKDLDELSLIISCLQPSIIINCVGLLVNECESDPPRAIYLNSYFPHWLAHTTKGMNTKLIHLSTDCVFDGVKGGYVEGDETSGEGWYATSKICGEVVNDKDLTLRLSIVGDELKDGSGLFQWFMKQEESTHGYTNCYWSGITTLELAKQLDRLVDTNLTGIYHLTPPFKISKYELLRLIAEVWKKDIEVLPLTNFSKDKSLKNNRKSEYDPRIPSYETQLREYKEWI